MKKFTYAIVAILAIALFATACSNPSDSSRKGGETAHDEQEAVQTGFNRLSDSQQVPTFDWSQERQTLIDLLKIRANGALGTTSFYLEGVGLMGWCPSKGAPVPSTYQLSGTKQWVDIPDDESRTLYDIDQGEPTGVYVGQSNATWVLCLDDNGKPFAHYWEGPVGSTVGIVNGLPADKRVQVNETTFEFTEAPK